MDSNIVYIFVVHGRACKGAGPFGEGGGRKLAPPEEGILKNPSQPRGSNRAGAQSERRDKIRPDKFFIIIIPAKEGPVY
mgnify:CR=1 FL=1